MATSILFMTFQEPADQALLDFACMATPWLFVLGFSTSFSAILAKLRRVNLLVSQSLSMHRVTVKARAVFVEVLVVTLVNVVLLSTWTALDPWVWLRVEMNSIDEFGRSVESYGTCGSMGGAGGTSNTSLIIVSIIVVWNFVAVAGANYQAYLTRNMPSSFNEALHLSICMAMLLEAFLLGVPLLFMVGSRPIAAFSVRLLLVTAICAAVLGPMFLPRVLKRHGRAKSRGWSRYWASKRSNKGSNRDVVARMDDTMPVDSWNGVANTTSVTQRSSMASSVRRILSSKRRSTRGSEYTEGELGGDSSTGRRRRSSVAESIRQFAAKQRRANFELSYSASNVAQLKENIRKKASVKSEIPDDGAVGACPASAGAPLVEARRTSVTFKLPINENQV